MRIKNALRNSFFSVISQIILIMVGFFSQRVLNLRMGEELVGMNSVISNVISLLSVTELGISTAVVYHLYACLADKDEKKIASLMNLYRKAYTIFALVITILGLCIMPFIHLFLKENSFTLDYIRLIYGLWLIRTVFSYLLSYKRSILIADQQEYIVSIGVLFANVMNYSLIILIVELWKNYALALTLNVFVEVILNLYISKYVGKKYPYLKELRNEPLQREVLSKVFGDIKNIFVTRISSKLLISTDSLIMSSFVSVGIVGLYSNYCMITQSLTNIVVAMLNALQPSVGNMFVEGEHEKEYGVLRQITFIYFWIASFVTASLLSLMTPFVTDIWLNAEYALDMSIILWCVINFYTNTIGMPLTMMLGVTGLFKKERNISVIAALVNLVLSLVLVMYWGVIGVLLGTFAAYIVQLVFRIRVVIGKYMQLDCKKYVIELLQYALLTIVETGLTYAVCSRIYQSSNLFSIALMVIICVLIPNGINFICYFKSWRFKSLLGMAGGLLRGIRK